MSKKLLLLLAVLTFSVACEKEDQIAETNTIEVAPDLALQDLPMPVDFSSSTTGKRFNVTHPQFLWNLSIDNTIWNTPWYIQSALNGLGLHYNENDDFVGELDGKGRWLRNRAWLFEGNDDRKFIVIYVAGYEYAIVTLDDDTPSDTPVASWTTYTHQLKVVFRNDVDLAGYVLNNTNRASTGKRALSTSKTEILTGASAILSTTKVIELKQVFGHFQSVSGFPYEVKDADEFLSGLSFIYYDQDKNPFALLNRKDKWYAMAVAGNFLQIEAIGDPYEYIDDKKGKVKPEVIRPYIRLSVTEVRPFIGIFGENDGYLYSLNVEGGHLPSAANLHFSLRSPQGARDFYASPNSRVIPLLQGTSDGGIAVTVNGADTGSFILTLEGGVGLPVNLGSYSIGPNSTLNKTIYLD